MIVGELSWTVQSLQGEIGLAKSSHALSLGKGSSTLQWGSPLSALYNTCIQYPLKQQLATNNQDLQYLLFFLEEDSAQDMKFLSL